MNLLRITLVILLVVIMKAPSVAGVAGQSGNSQKSRLAGVVLDRNRARIVGAVITIQNTEFKRRLRSDNEGEFELELPAGSYDITAEQTGFKKFQSSSFRVNAGATELINIHMEVEPPKTPLKVNSTER